MPLLSSLDVGSNTVRLLVAETAPPNNFRPLRVERRITRLGGSFSAEGELDEASIERTCEAIRTLAGMARAEGAEKIFAVGTGVLRRAKNREVFLERVRKEAGVPIRVISGEEEGRLMLKGVLSSLEHSATPRLVADTGGWSTEILWVEKKEIAHAVSLELGVVSLAENFLRNDPPGTGELAALETNIRSVLQDTRGKWERAGRDLGRLNAAMAGTAGTATTLAAIDLGLEVYDPLKINGHRIPAPDLERIYDRLRSMPSPQRRGIPGLEEGREDLIVPGALIFRTELQVFGLSSLEVIDSGLLEGVLIECGMRNSECGILS
ncbi:MAG TPA: hypothetical protein VLS90_01040, partial [Thermodesulfobacteriota bacterium]|nr:hypothetical protein [Thermodesulfobacteriota bacterium]